MKTAARSEARLFDVSARVRDWQRIMANAPKTSRLEIFRRACGDLMNIEAVAEAADALQEIAIAHDLPPELVQDAMAQARRSPTGNSDRRDDAVELIDFVAYMPTHSYIFKP